MLVPSTLVVDDRCVDTIEIAAPADCRSYRDRIAHLHTLRIRFGRQREIAHRPGKIRRRVRRQRFHLERGRFASQRDSLRLEQCEIAKKRIVKWIDIKEIEWRAAPWSISVRRVAPRQ